MNALANWYTSVAEITFEPAVGVLLVKVTLLLLMAWLAQRLLASVNPRWRVLLWRATAIGLILLVAFAAFPPTLEWAVLPAGERVAAHPKMIVNTGPAYEVVDTGNIKRTVAVADDPVFPSSAVAPPRPNAGNEADLAQSVVLSPRRVESPQFQLHASQSKNVAMDRPRETPVEASAGTQKVSHPESKKPGVFSSRWVSAIWLIGFGIGTVRTVLAIQRLRAIIGRSRRVPSWLLRTATALAAELGHRAEVSLRQTSELATPCLAGFQRPVVLLPEGQCEEEHRDDLRAVLAHELAHVRGHDLLWNTLLHFLSQVLWFHPLAWRIRSAHADACDAVADAVAANCVGNDDAYCRTLARMAVRMNAPLSSASLAMAGSSKVWQRIEFLRRRCFATPLPRHRTAVVLVVAALLTVLFGGVTLTRAQEASPPIKASVGSPKPQVAKKPDAAKEQPSAGAPGKPSQQEVRRLTVNAVLDDAGEPIAGASFRFHGRVGGKIFNEEVTTNKQGEASVRWQADAEVSHLWMTGKKQGLVPQHYVWRNERKEIELPNRIELRFKTGRRIEGVVQDEAGQPIADATVDISMPITSPKLANYVFTAANFKTDAEGRWSWDSAPSELGDLSIAVTHPEFLRSWAKASSKGEAVAVLKQGLHVAGRVLTADNEPIEDATVRLGFDRFGSNDPEAKTDANGRFVLKNCKAGKSLVTVNVKGFSPQMRDVVVGEQKDVGVFLLEPGHVMRVRIVDINGNPIPKATMAADTWRSYRTIDFRGDADAEGKLTWSAAPEDTVLCDFFKTGYMSVRRKPLQASDEELVVSLPPLLDIKGRVTDAITGDPLPAFQIRYGYQWSNRDEVAWSNDEGTAYKNGTYEYKFNEPIEGRYVLQAIAPGYLPSASRAIRSDEGAIAIDFALKRGSGPSGIVLGADGHPVADASVAVATEKNRASLDNGFFERGRGGEETVRTDAEGKFELRSQGDDPYLIIAVHDSGFAEVTHEQFQKSNKIQLEPWGKIEGRVMLGDKPDAGRNVSFYPKRPDRKGMFVFSYGYETQTNKEGRFAFDRVLPGPGTVSRVVVTEFLDSWQHAPGWQQAVDIQPTETTTVTIGGTGQNVVGRVVLDRQPDVTIDWTLNEPATIERWDVANNQRDRSFFRCLGPIDKSGRFEIPDVPPGEYRLEIPVNNPPSPNSCGAGGKIGGATQRFTVPPLADARTEDALDLGEVTATLFDTLDPGELAPDFVAQDLSGGQTRLRDLHGKVVLLDFWATWCVPCRAQMPALKEIYERFGDNDRFALLSVSCDNAIDSPRDYVAENGMAWLQAFVPGMYSGVVKEYTVRALPGTFLIGPDGRVIAKNLNREELEQAIAAALKNEELFTRADKEGHPPRFPVVHFEPKPGDDLAAKPAVILLDNCDESWERDTPHTDGLHVLSADGEELKVLREFNNAQSIGGVHGVAVDRQRGRLYVRESVGKRLTAFNQQAQKLWQVEKIEADVVAVDPKTGHVWCSGGSRLNTGETVVFDESGREVAAFPLRAIDMEYDAHDDAFWLVGYEILKVSRDGEVLFRKSVDGWCCASVSVDSRDGSVWFIERDHRDIAKSRNRLWKLNADGSVAVNRDLEDKKVFAVEMDPSTNQVWVATLVNGGLCRFTMEGEPGGESEILAYSLASSKEGLWAATKEALVLLDKSGNETQRLELNCSSQQAWIATW